ncbi:MAG: polyribonucleotide nucleotidyltransferase [Waddliaceae bacterium]
MERKTKEITLGRDTLKLETGYIARQSNGAVLITVGETMVFGTANAAKEASSDVDFIPLRVDFQEKLSSVGRTLGGFIKREGRPSQRETLLSRLIDRPIRPMFEDGFFTETQVLVYVWSYDGVHSTDPLAICAASAALSLSDIPLIKPIGAVRVGMIDDAFIVNPTVQEQEQSKLDLIIAGTEDAVLMIEGYCDFLTEEQVVEAITKGHEGIAHFCHELAKWQKEIGKEKNRTQLRPIPAELISEMKPFTDPLFDQALRHTDKTERETALNEVKASVKEKFLGEGSQFSSTDVSIAFKKLSAEFMRNIVIKEEKRSDGRKFNEIRQITIDQSILPRVHGSSLFTRGETQALAVCTLGGQSMAQRYEDLHGEGSHDFYLQYSFPPFSVGEVGRMGGPGRREVGHGKLAERALMYSLPNPEDFPYTIRLESNITESNGSSSMASVCGGCLAMMDAGVPISRPVSGIAMGLILESDHCVVLSDILGIEDALGDMDFKITGDMEGITAFQMDIKVEGITIDIMRKALNQAKEGRAHILQKMLEVCPKARAKPVAHAPRIEAMQIKPSKIGAVIGPGGKQIRAIVEETGVEVDIEDDGRINLTAHDEESLERAKEIFFGIIAEVEIGKTYTGRVTSIKDFGAFVEVLPGKEGLCHISEFDNKRVDNINEYVKEGDTLTVKVLDINDRGQIKLSRKALLTS